LLYASTIRILSAPEQQERVMPDLGDAHKTTVGITEVREHQGAQNVNATVVTFLQFNDLQFVMQLTVYAY
jgi:hypothetical protein